MNRFILDKPYPSIEDVVPNRHDLNMIYENYSGLISELTAITQYFYNHLISGQEGEAEISQTIKEISIAEMMHLDKFGELILKLGGDPKFLYPKNRGFSYWNGDLVSYKKGIVAILKSAISLEKETIDLYYKQAYTTCQKAISDLLLRIIEDEELHLNAFKEMLSVVSQ